jgi:hypothetical protein
MLIPEHVMNDPLESRSDDIGIAGYWPEDHAFTGVPDAYANEVKDLGDESIFGLSAFERRINKKLAYSNIC